MRWTPIYANTNKVNKTCVLLQTTGGKDKANFVFMRISKLSVYFLNYIFDRKYLWLKFEKGRQ
jgi:hypothetical protein